MTTAMPSTCLFQKGMLSFLFGYRNYLGKELLRDIANGEPMSIPDNDPVFVTFPKILDNIDINEDVLAFWTEEIINNSKPADIKNIDLMM